MEKVDFLKQKWSEINKIQKDLFNNFNKTFAIDGRMRGDFGECLAEILFDLKRANGVGVDCTTQDGTGVQVKFYGIDSIPLYDIRDKNNKIEDEEKKEKTHLIIFHLSNSNNDNNNCLSNVQIIWNDLVANLPNQKMMSWTKLKKIESKKPLKYNEDLWNYLKGRKKLTIK